MRENFRSFAELLKRVPEPDGNSTEPPVDPNVDELAAAREVRLFRARVGEAIETAIHIVCADIAAEIVGRELQLAPPQLHEIVQRALDRYALDQPVRVRVHPEDAVELSCDLPVVGDIQMKRGDALLELRDGFVDASLGVRLEAVLAAR